MPRDHTWGVSSAVDRVWAQVSGLAPHFAGRRSLMVFQAFIDDSSSDDIHVLAGHIAPAENWAALSKEWERLLPRFGTLNKNDQYHFKMVEMAATPERMERVAAFYRLIEKHVSFSLSVWLRASETERAIAALHTDGLLVQNNSRPFDLLYMGIMHMLAHNFDMIASHTGLTRPVDFYFDQQSEKGVVFSTWEQFREASGEDVRALIKSPPHFEDDTEFLPLQSADLWAWWVREWHIAGTPEQLHMPDFGSFKAHRKGHLKLDLHLLAACAHA